MKDKIKSAFLKCVEDKCLSTVNHKKFKIFDREDNCCFICTENEPKSLAHFNINNPNIKDIHFLAIDKCLIVSDDKKCDCALFDDKKFHFVEIKTSKLRQRSERRSQAFEQLKSTIGIFKEKIDFTGFEVFAQVCIGAVSTYPRRPSSQMGKIVELYDLYKVKLEEGNLIEFE